MQIAQEMKLFAAACLAATLMDTSAALPGRIEYAVNFGKESASVGRFLPVGATFWKEGKAWNQSTSSAVSPAQGYDEVSDIYRTYVYPNDATVGLSAAYLLPGLTPGASYTLRLHLCEVYFTEAATVRSTSRSTGWRRRAASMPMSLPAGSCRARTSTFPSRPIRLGPWPSSLSTSSTSTTSARSRCFPHPTRFPCRSRASAASRAG